MRKKLVNVIMGKTCLESYPCQHSVTLQYSDGSSEKKGNWFSTMILKHYKQYLNEETIRHLMF